MPCRWTCRPTTAVTHVPRYLLPLSVLCLSPLASPLHALPTGLLCQFPHSRPKHPSSPQAYFAYDAHKSGGVTISHLRFGPEPIGSSYEIEQADYLAVHHASYIQK